MTTHQVSGFADEESTESSDLAEPASATVSRLTDEQIQEITSLLRAGRRLPPYLFPHLFETAREYELAYSGKARRIDVLAEMVLHEEGRDPSLPDLPTPNAAPASPTP